MALAFVRRVIAVGFERVRVVARAEVEQSIRPPLQRAAVVADFVRALDRHIENRDFRTQVQHAVLQREAREAVHQFFRMGVVEENVAVFGEGRIQGDALQSVLTRIGAVAVRFLEMFDRDLGDFENTTSRWPDAQQFPLTLGEEDIAIRGDIECHRILQTGGDGGARERLGEGRGAEEGQQRKC